MLFNEKHIFRKFKQEVKQLRRKFNLRNLIQYFTQKINFDNFVYIKKVLQQKENFNLKN